MRRVGIRTFRHRTVAPVRTAEVVVREPQFLGTAIHAFEVEHAAVRDERFETFLVVAGQEVDRIAAVAGAHAAHPGLVGPRFARHVVDRTEVIANVLAAVITRDLVEPLLPERRQPAPVRRHDDIALRSHQLEIPAETPALAHHTLRTALAVKQHRIGFGRIEIGGQDYPRQHLFAVGGLDPALAHFAHPDIVVNLLVRIGQL